MDWVKFADRFNEGVSTFGEERIRLVREKLSLRNPAFIASEELAQSVLAGKRPEVLPKLQSFARGDPVENVRAKVGETCASCREQVDCLLDLATDPNILARFWGGWCAFL